MKKALQMPQLRASNTVSEAAASPGGARGNNAAGPGYGIFEGLRPRSLPPTWQPVPAVPA